MADPRFITLSTNERAECAHTHVIEITADNLTVTATNTLQTFTLPFTFAIGDIVERVTWYLATPFQDASDAAFNTDTISVGDSVGGVATLLAAKEANVNGTEVLNTSAVPTGTPSTGFTAATNLTVTVNSMSAKALNDIDTGRVVIAVRIVRPRLLVQAMPYGSLKVKG
jgi:hypothetical protein